MDLISFKNTVQKRILTNSKSNPNKPSKTTQNQNQPQKQSIKTNQNPKNQPKNQNPNPKTYPTVNQKQQEPKNG
ncbi:hypothetical protein [Methanimicrococcus hacksteinii]|uniref:hypothetical protein n=1 Tax=Methanimicrococcus hacksteinii TaxID=3028293 RepID=UPI00298EEDC1|nr:hypothetical protein [Methanimicrococcus sp. At1]